MANNLQDEVLLVFHLKQVNQHNQDTLDKKNQGQTVIDDAFDDGADSDEENEESNLKLRPGDEKQVRLKLMPNEIFRVPLMWMMPDSKVDVYIAELVPGQADEDVKLHLMYKNIS